MTMQRSNSSEIYRDEDSRLRVLKFDLHSEPMDPVIRIRSERAETELDAIDEFDASADLYLLLQGEIPVATMRTHQARRTLLDCEDCYPRAFLAEHSDVVVSASRFARSETTPSSPSLMRRFIGEVWRDQSRDGMWVDLINATPAMVPYYTRLGYRHLCGSSFRHPRLGTPSVVLFAVADPYTRSPLQRYFEPSATREDLNRLRSGLPTCDERVCPRVGENPLRRTVGPDMRDMKGWERRLGAA